MLVLDVVVGVSDGTSRQSRLLVNQSTDRLREWQAINEAQYVVSHDFT